MCKRDYMSILIIAILGKNILAMMYAECTHAINSWYEKQDTRLIYSLTFDFIMNRFQAGMHS